MVPQRSLYIHPEGYMFVFEGSTPVQRWVSSPTQMLPSNRVLTPMFPLAASSAAAVVLSCLFRNVGLFRSFFVAFSMCFLSVFFLLRVFVVVICSCLFVLVRLFVLVCFFFFLRQPSASICWPFGLPPFLECLESRRWMTTSWHSEYLPATTAENNVKEVEHNASARWARGQFVGRPWPLGYPL